MKINTTGYISPSNNMDKTVAAKCRICYKDVQNYNSLNDDFDSLKCSNYLKEYLCVKIQNDEKHACELCPKCKRQLGVIANFVITLRVSNDKLKEAVNLNIPYYEYLNKTVKTDDENLPLSVISAALKEEVESHYEYHVEETEDVDFYDSEILQEDAHEVDDLESKRKKELGNNFVMVISEKNGSKRNMVKCLTCGLIVQNKSAFIIHNRRHTGEKPCLCKYCHKRFTQSGSLLEHIRKNHPNVYLRDGKRTLKRKREQFYICQYCGKNFAKKNYLTVHVRIHTSEKPYQCSQCPKAFRRCIDFIQHRRIHSGDKPYSCHICGRSFVSHTPLKRHLNVHSEERKFKCDICNIAVKSKDSLKKHVIVMHTTERPNVCLTCGATFALKYNLKSHMKTKHSEKSGLCNICKKEFSNIQKHMVTHSSEKNFSCLMCNRKFFTEKGLATHSLTHNVENASYTCSYDGCLAAFPKQTKLDFHILKYHSNSTPHVCEYCCKEFYRLPDLRRHIKSVHPPSKTDLPPPKLLLQSECNDQ